jgi:phospholipid-translocating ATPase
LFLQVNDYCIQSNIVSIILGSVSNDSKSFALVSGFSGSTLFNSYALACYNSIFTALPCVGFVLDKDVTESSLLRIPQIYQYSQNGYYMNARTMLLWFLRAVYQAVVIYIVCFGVYGTRFASVLSGRPMDYWAIGLVPYSAVLTIQMVTMALETNYWTWINHVLIWGSYILYIVLSLAISSVPLIKSAGIENLYWTYINLFSDPIFYLTVILATVLAILPVAIVKTFTTNFYPTLVDDVRRMESKQRRHKFVSKKRKTTIEEQPLWASSSDDVSQSLIEEDDYNYTFTESRENKLSVIIEDEKLE